jgi:hypothetical protein
MARLCGESFRVALRPEPSNFAVPSEPLINLGFGFEAGYISNFFAGAVSLDLPIAFRNPVGMKDDAGRFAHKQTIVSLYDSRQWPILGLNQN